jgi:hypothetical protein
MEAAIAVVNTEELEKKSISLASYANSLQVVDAQTFEYAGEFLKNVKALQKEIADTFDPVIEHWHRKHKSSLEEKKIQLDPLVSIEAEVKNKMRLYSIEVETARREELRKQQEEFRRRDEARRAAELAAAKRKQAEDEALRLALDASKAGNNELADEIMAAPLPEVPDIPELKPITVRPIIPQPKAAGISTTRVWKWRLVCFADVPNEFKSLDQSSVNAHVRSNKDESHIPGIEVYEDIQIGSRSA